MTTDQVRLRALVSGQVQGVGFRTSVIWEARALQLKGYVRNLPDGRVEVVAEGSELQLVNLERYLRHGPPGARVSQVETFWLPATGGFDDFTLA